MAIQNTVTAQGPRPVGRPPKMREQLKRVASDVVAHPTKAVVLQVVDGDKAYSRANYYNRVLGEFAPGARAYVRQQVDGTKAVMVAAKQA